MYPTPAPWEIARLAATLNFVSYCDERSRTMNSPPLPRLLALALLPSVDTNYLLGERLKAGVFSSYIGAGWEDD